jgi:predicted restriction endonuclease
MKLCNLASLDPAHQQRGVKGLSAASNADRKVWNEFHANWDDLILESERLRASVVGQSAVADDEVGAVSQFTGETERARLVNIRVAQRFFRRAVLASYDRRCCITGIAVPELLIASHIVSWKSSVDHRANPCNGLCLSRLHHGAFDKGLITIAADLRLVVSHRLKDEFVNAVVRSCFHEYEGKKISRPSRFSPDLSLLDTHRNTVFRG